MESQNETSACNVIGSSREASGALETYLRGA